MSLIKNKLITFLQNDHILFDILNAFSMEGTIEYTAYHPLPFNKSSLVFSHTYMLAHTRTRTFDYLTYTCHANVCPVNFLVCIHTEMLTLLPGKALPRISKWIKKGLFQWLFNNIYTKIDEPLKKNFEPSLATLIGKYFKENSQYKISSGYVTHQYADIVRFICKTGCCVECSVLTAVAMKHVVCWNVTPCSSERWYFLDEHIASIFKVVE
jgi:hypothetical protein